MPRLTSGHYVIGTFTPGGSRVPHSENQWARVAVSTRFRVVWCGNFAPRCSAVIRVLADRARRCAVIRAASASIEMQGRLPPPAREKPFTIGQQGDEMARVAKVDSEQIIADYRMAFRLANEQEPPRIVYEQGWFRFVGPRHYARMRRREIVDATRRLTARANERTLTAPQPAQGGEL